MKSLLVFSLPFIDSLSYDNGSGVFVTDSPSLTCLPQSSRLACDSSVSAGDAEQLRSVCSKDPLYELSEQEKDFLWRHR